MLLLSRKKPSNRLIGSDNFWSVAEANSPQELEEMIEDGQEVAIITGNPVFQASKGEYKIINGKVPYKLSKETFYYVTFGYTES